MTREEMIYLIKSGINQAIGSQHRAEKMRNQYLYKYSQGVEDGLRYVLRYVENDTPDAGNKNEWVSVLDRLPEQDHVLVSTRYGIREANKYVFKSDQFKYLNITHWMPLPEPPQEAEVSELSPCPFCGGKAKIGDGGHSGKCWVVWCPNCDIEFVLGTKEKAIETWNRRTI